MLKKSGNFVTYDNLAVRLWSLSKQIKAFHLKVKENLSFLCMVYVERVEGVLLLFSTTKSETEPGGIGILIGENLSVLQRIPLSYSTITKYGISPEMSNIILLGQKNKNNFFTTSKKYSL
jgi:hypothetical protein